MRLKLQAEAITKAHKIGHYQCVSALYVYVCMCVCVIGGVMGCFCSWLKGLAIVTESE